MKRFILIFLIFAFLPIITKSEQNDVGLSFKLNRSLSVLPFEEARLNEDSDKELKVVNGIFSIAADLFYKSKRRAYLNLSMEYSSLLVNDDFYDLNGQSLNGYFVKIGFNGISYMETPDKFTPYLGYGLGVIFINTNQDNLTTYKKDDYETSKGDLFAEFTLSIDLKGGLLIPINEKFALTTDLDFGIYFSQYLGLIPKLQVGGIYWLD